MRAWVFKHGPVPAQAHPLAGNSPSQTCSFRTYVCAWLSQVELVREDCMAAGRPQVQRILGATQSCHSVGSRAASNTPASSMCSVHRTCICDTSPTCVPARLALWICMCKLCSARQCNQNPWSMVSQHGLLAMIGVGGMGAVGAACEKERARNTA